MDHITREGLLVMYLNEEHRLKLKDVFSLTARHRIAFQTILKLFKSVTLSIGSTRQPRGGIGQIEEVRRENAQVVMPLQSQDAVI